jgi:membrane dipeptidase
MIPVFDGHNDTVLKLLEDPTRDFFSRQDDGHIDYVRAQEAGFFGGFFAVYTPGPALDARWTDLNTFPGLAYPPPFGAVELTDAVRNTNAAVATILGWAADPEGRFKIVRSVSEIRDCMGAGVMAGILHFEGAEAIGPDLAALDVYHAAGLRSLGPVWSRPTLFAEGVPFAFPASPDTGPGLTPHGRALVKRCNELRIMIDLSHMNEKGFWDVAALSDAPLVATHSNVHAICPSPRNLTDEQLEAVRASGGVVGLNFATGFLDEGGSREPDLPLEVMVRHVDHLVDKLGPDGVALGSDFDGAGISDEIGDVTGVQRLLEALRAAGYDQATLEKIAYGNWLSVLERTWGN